MLKNENIIIFSSDDWKSGLKSSKYHIAKHFSRHNKVLFVNSIGLRNPGINKSDISRIFAKLFSFFSGYHKVSDNLFVCTPVVVPFHSFRGVKSINANLLVWFIRLMMFRLSMKRPILIIFMPNVKDVIGRLNEKCVVYYCIDELKGYREVDRNVFEKDETELLRRADCVVTCSAELNEIKKKSNPHTYYIPHGVEWAHFRSALNPQLPIPRDIEEFRKPIIGFYGFISDDWIDFALLDHMAVVHPEWSVVLIGRSKGDINKRLKTANIHFLGIRSFEELPAYNKAFDVSIIPFVINQLTMSSNPLKLFEYLSSGKPVVSVDIPEVRNHAAWVKIASSHEQFVRHIEECLLEDTLECRLMRSDAMRNETWENRIDLLSRIINEHTHEQ
ncbi:MAG: putative teichuronic acid biosynthesis glycosyltransferase TuaH [Pelotomaculum sp. PtaU1.Bin065]|nr:MAG: putative teichuronic acid biosynthesis glycosyltransferase TuaH [Pelotomaculum sp. PtaU1.Bin065]